MSGIVIIGMRGAGKTTFGRSAAQKLGYKFADLDAVIERTVGPIPKYVRGDSSACVCIGSVFGCCHRPHLEILLT